MWGWAPPSGPPPAATENKSTKTWSAWGGKVADLSKEKGQEPFPQWAFIGFNLHRNTGKARQSLSGSKDQTIDNIQRTLRAYSESGLVSWRAIKLWETNSFHDWTLLRKLRTFLANQVSQGCMYSFLGLIAPGNPPFPAQGCTTLGHCFRLMSGRGSKAAKRLGDFLQTEWGLRLCQSWGVRVHHPHFL